MHDVLDFHVSVSVLLKKEEIMGAHNYEDLIRHVGHKIVVATYGDIGMDHKKQGSGRMFKVHNVAVECETCHEVILDFDHPDIAE